MSNTEFINGVYALPDESHATLYARQSETVKQLQDQVKDLEGLIDQKNQQIRALTHKAITLKNQLHGLYKGAITLTQALEAAEQSPVIEIF